MKTAGFILCLTIGLYGLVRAGLALVGVEETPPDAFWGWWAVAGVAMYLADRWTSE